ncbi:MAG: tRNA (guanosine(37)-N1)-methyltransferase TrmD [bacterium]
MISINPWSLRRFAADQQGQIDDMAYGGEFGMVMKPEPYFRGVEHLRGYCRDPLVILTAPDGKKFDNKAAKSLSKRREIIILTGRYEGIDARVRKNIVDETWSIGPFITPGGDLPALTMISAISRQIPGVVGSRHSVEADSFQDDRLAPPHYTRPSEFRGYKVPEVLLSGDHEKIKQWRLEQSRQRTENYRKKLTEDR